MNTRTPDPNWTPKYAEQMAAEEATYLAGRALSECHANRREAYGSIADQLDLIYHQGLDAWTAHIAAVKEAYPKPIT